MIAPYLVPLFIESLSEKYPELQVEIVETGIREMALHLENEELDGGIAIHPFDKEGFYEEVLFDEKFVLYVGSDHPLSKQKVVSWNEIPFGDLILQEDLQAHFLRPSSKKNDQSNLSRKIRNIHIQSGSFETIRKIIDRNGGLTLLPQLSTLYMGARRLKMIRPLENPVISRKIVLVTPRGFEKNRITKVIRSEILNNLPAQ